MTHDLKVDTSVKGIILLTLPISLARLVPELNFYSMLFLGHLGTKELAYAALTGVYYLIFAAMGYGLSNAILSMISRQAGENNRMNIINTLRHGYIVAALLAVLATGITFWTNPMLTAVGMSHEDAHFVIDFMHIRIWGLLFLLGINFLILTSFVSRKQDGCCLHPSSKVWPILFWITGLFLEVGALLPWVLMVQHMLR